MYLHIGNDILIKKENIIAIFNLEKINLKKDFQEFLESIIIENKNDIENEKKKSIIIVKQENKIKGYYSNISSVTLQKREESFSIN